MLLKNEGKKVDIGVVCEEIETIKKIKKNFFNKNIM